EVLTIPCFGLAERVEAGDDREVAKILTKLVGLPIKNKKVDVVVSGCTHYPLIREQIERVISPALFIEPGEAVAAQVVRLVGDQKSGGGKTVWETTGDRAEFVQRIAPFLS
ncbi:hypothetical protein MUP65_00395, partial [Patescibacteria group bacterium]|nr:hypothetical protein [Patescibacteria group bacterium]